MDLHICQLQIHKWHGFYYLIKKYNLTNKVELKTIGIRPGEKIHEEMISSEEWMRTYKNGKNYLIGDNIIAPEGKSYSSRDSIMDDIETYNFLIENGVI